MSVIDVMIMMFMNLNDTAILNIFGVDYLCVIFGVSISEAINLLRNADLREKKWIIVKYEKKI